MNSSCGACLQKYGICKYVWKAIKHTQFLKSSLPGKTETMPHPPRTQAHLMITEAMSQIGCPK